VVKLIIYLLVVNIGLFFRWLHWEKVNECENVSSQCADAGFGWEALGSILLLCSHIFLLFIIISWCTRYI